MRVPDVTDASMSDLFPLTKDELIRLRDGGLLTLEGDDGADPELKDEYKNDEDLVDLIEKWISEF